MTSIEDKVKEINQLIFELISFDRINSKADLCTQLMIQESTVSRLLSIKKRHKELDHLKDNILKNYYEEN